MRVAQSIVIKFSSNSSYRQEGDFPSSVPNPRLLNRFLLFLSHQIKSNLQHRYKLRWYCYVQTALTAAFPRPTPILRGMAKRRGKIPGVALNTGRVTAVLPLINYVYMC